MLGTFAMITAKNKKRLHRRAGLYYKFLHRIGAPLSSEYGAVMPSCVCTRRRQPYPPSWHMAHVRSPGSPGSPPKTRRDLQSHSCRSRSAGQ